MKIQYQLLCSAFALSLGVLVSSPLLPVEESLEGDADRAPNLHTLFPAKDVRHYENEIQSTYANIDVIVSPNDGYAQGETAVAINPVKPNIIVAASNDFRGINGSTNVYIYYSTNSGQTWVNKLLPSVSATGYNATSDPSLTYDVDGVAYYSYGVFNQTTNVSAIIVTRSLDGGVNWEAPVIAKTNDPNSFEDKYIIAADATKTSPRKNNVYLSWTHFVNYQTGGQSENIFCVRSTNKGQAWSAPVQVSYTNGGHLSMPVVAPNGDVYVVWSEANGSGTSGMMISRSADGGATFGVPRMITGTAVYSLPTTLTTKGNMRMITYPVAAIDCSPAHTGRIYTSWAARSGAGGPAHIFMSYSDNQATSWSTPIAIDQEFASSTDKFHPWLACDPISGVVAVSYYDGRNDPTNAKTDMYVAISNDGGLTWSPKRISNTNFRIGTSGGYWADYSAVAAYKGKIIPCWTDQRGGNTVSNTDVYISVMSLGPGAVMNLAASIKSTEETSITLRWTDPTTMVSGDPLTNFSVVIYRDSNFLIPIATVAKGVMTYRDSLLGTGEYHSYQVYVATPTDTSDLASASAYAGGALQPQPAVLLGVRETVDGTELRWKNPTKHIDGTPLHDLSAVFFYVDGVRSNAGQLSSDTGKIVLRNVIAATKKFHTFSLAVVTNRGGFTTASVKTDSMIWYSGAPATTMSESFESSPVFGVTRGTNNEQWVTSTLGAHTGTHSLCDNAVAKTQKSQNILAMLPPVVIQSTATLFSFWDVPIVAGSDSALAEFSNDHGATWHLIQRYTQASGSSDSVQKSTWKNETYSMTSYVGDTVVFRFRMRSRPIQNKQGWYVDDVTMRAAGGVAVNEPSLQPELPLIVASAPNPFTAETWISTGSVVSASEHSVASLFVYDINGRMVADLTPQLASGVPVRARFAANDHPAGSYFARLRIGAREGTTRFVLQR